MSSSLNANIASTLTLDAAGKFPADLLNAADLIGDALGLVGKHIGDSTSVDQNGRRYPKGFTPPVDYIINPNDTNPDTGIPTELGINYVNIHGIRLEGKGNGSLGPINNKITKANYKNGNQVLIPGSVNFNNLKSDPSYDGPFAYPGPYQAASDNILNGFTPITSNDKYDTRISTLDVFKSYSTKEFTHLLDYFIDSQGKYSIQKIVPENMNITPDSGKHLLASFVRTTDDNEDPTMLGYDIILKFNSSPLFNGTIDSFISQYSDNTEVSSRSGILSNFKSQLFKFLKIDSPIQQGIDPTDIEQAKKYYLRNLTGINNLSESYDSGTLKSFIDYGKDFIGMEFYEDVSQNIGYLSTLYKMLSWSRLNGKQVIPENLLRFDVDIVVSEIRNYNRVFRDETDVTKIDVYADVKSKYTYSLYECQFFFTDLPHGDGIDLGGPKTIDNHAIKFNYKYSTMKFSKFINPSINESIINNAYLDVNRVSPMDTNNSYVGSDGSIVNDKPINYLTEYDYYPRVNTNTGQSDTLAGAKQNDKTFMKNRWVRKIQNQLTDWYNAAQNSSTSNTNNDSPPDLATDKIFSALGGVLMNAVGTNVKVDIQAQLLNKTLENIRNSGK